jgi:hypothetical protein
VREAVSGDQISHIRVQQVIIKQRCVKVNQAYFNQRRRPCGHSSCRRHAHFAPHNVAREEVTMDDASSEVQPVHCSRERLEVTLHEARWHDFVVKIGHDVRENEGP